MSYLNELKERLEKQDNLATATPYLVVLQDLKCVGVVHDDYFYGDKDSVEIRDEKVSADSEETVKVLYKYEDVNWFFTQEAAKKHMEENYYHYKKPRTYIKHCWRNPEMTALFEQIGVRR
jgi:hypothetical protein